MQIIAWTQNIACRLWQNNKEYKPTITGGFNMSFSLLMVFKIITLLGCSYYTIHLLKVYNSMVFSIFMGYAAITTINFRTFLHSKKKMPFSYCAPIIHLPPPALASLLMSCVSIEFAFYECFMAICQTLVTGTFLPNALSVFSFISLYERVSVLHSFS